MNHIAKIVLSSAVIIYGKTPLEYTVSISNGYDNNVLRLSKNELDRANRNDNILGGASTYDSFVTRAGLIFRKDLWNFERKSVGMKFLYSYSNNIHFYEKKYWSGGIDLTYKWGSYKSLRYSIRHLNDFYLRHYINRDISTNNLEPCKFSDRDQIVLITQKISKYIWVNFGSGYLQRYYAKPFTEFDLDILYLRGKLNYKIQRLGSVSLQVTTGRAISDSGELPKRPSSFDRSYSNMEIYMPLKLRFKNHFFKEYGVSLRIDERIYDAENEEDVLHAGRSHIDQKYDLWIKKNIRQDIRLKLSGRYRIRKTSSAYGWVEDLKSFKQLQCALSMEWDFVYDRY